METPTIMCNLCLAVELAIGDATILAFFMGKVKNVISFQCKAWKDQQKFGTQWNEFDFLKSGTERERNAFHFGICWNGTERFPDLGCENGTERFPFEMERSAPLGAHS